MLERQEMIYCGACGMPPEYCEWGPDYETHCLPWLKKHHSALFEELAEKRGTPAASAGDAKDEKPVKQRPEAPWTTEQRLMEFYKQYEPNKLDNVPGLLEKYAGKEDKLFQALTKKYGPEPDDPYYDDSEDEEEDDEEELEEDMANVTLSAADKKKRRGAGAKKKKKGDGSGPRVVVQKRAQNKRRILTVIMGMETVEDVKLKDVSKAFSKRFAGSSSVKDGVPGPSGKSAKEIIIQGDHLYDVAEMIVDKFGVPDTAVFLDIDGDVVPLR
ncbi:Translation initiation factor SUI1 [Seminavis robusta]|uniref:Translation initiation factor SUI1 n=1 Tax=Seminavis robusta TaxID=568900 RepID=A0A9N8DLC8_9STRA|nr:Translation initiation factor SUI1 [Seminavis robusta]|eukprot:Sro218_g090080.1 Translation initiation factor SUI1 (271) ;mRNA; r:39245-40145